MLNSIDPLDQVIQGLHPLDEMAQKPTKPSEEEETKQLVIVNVKVSDEKK